MADDLDSRDGRKVSDETRKSLETGAALINVEKDLKAKSGQANPEEEKRDQEQWRNEG